MINMPAPRQHFAGQQLYLKLRFDAIDTDISAVLLAQNHIVGNYSWPSRPDGMVDLGTR